MAKLHHVQFGDTSKEPVVFLGSIGATVDMWIPQVNELSQDHHVIAVEHRGHGHSPVLPGPATMADLAQDVLETLDSLGVDHFHVAGLSMGGAVAQYLAATSTRVDSAAFLCTAANLGGKEGWEPTIALLHEKGSAALADAMTAGWQTEDYKASHPATQDALHRAFAAMPAEGFDGPCNALAEWDFTSRLGEITVPVLVVAADQDELTPLPTLEAIRDGVKGPVTYEVVEHAAHIPTFEAADRVTSLLSGFFA